MRASRNMWLSKPPKVTTSRVWPPSPPYPPSHVHGDCRSQSIYCYHCKQYTRVLVRVLHATASMCLASVCHVSRVFVYDVSRVCFICVACLSKVLHATCCSCVRLRAAPLPLCLANQAVPCAQCTVSFGCLICIASLFDMYDSAHCTPLWLHSPSTQPSPMGSRMQWSCNRVTSSPMAAPPTHPQGTKAASPPPSAPHSQLSELHYDWQLLRLQSIYCYDCNQYSYTRSCLCFTTTGKTAFSCSSQVICHALS